MHRLSSSLNSPASGVGRSPVSMMFDVRSFEGSPEELSDFVVSTWKSSYEGRMPVPLWSADYFRWQLRLDEPDSERRLVAAYKDNQLAGVVLYVPMAFEMGGERIEAAQASWLSVASEFQGQGVARTLHDGSQEILRSDQLAFQLGYGFFGAKSSKGVKFWKKMERKSTTFSRSVGFWARVIDPRRAGAWNLNRWEGWASGMFAPFLGLPRPRTLPNVQFRPAEAGDISQLVKLADLATKQCDLRLVWDENRLSPSDRASWIRRVPRRGGWRRSERGNRLPCSPHSRADGRTGWGD